MTVLFQPKNLQLLLVDNMVDNMTVLFLASGDVDSAFSSWHIHCQPKNLQLLLVHSIRWIVLFQQEILQLLMVAYMVELPHNHKLQLLHNHNHKVALLHIHMVEQDGLQLLMVDHMIELPHNHNHKVELLHNHNHKVELLHKHKVEQDGLQLLLVDHKVELLHNHKLQLLHNHNHKVELLHNHKVEHLHILLHILFLAYEDVDEAFSSWHIRCQREILLQMLAELLLVG